MLQKVLWLWNGYDTKNSPNDTQNLVAFSFDVSTIDDVDGCYFMTGTTAPKVINVRLM